MLVCLTVGTLELAAVYFSFNIQKIKKKITLIHWGGNEAIIAFQHIATSQNMLIG